MKKPVTTEQHIRDSLKRRFKYIDLDHELGRVLYEAAVARAIAFERPKK